MMQSTFNGQLVDFDTRNLSTSLTAITTAMAAKAMLQSVNVCNKTAGAVTFSLCKTSGANDTYYYSGKSIAANDTLKFTDHNIVLKAGDTLRALAGTGTALDVSVTLIQASQPG